MTVELPTDPCNCRIVVKDKVRIAPGRKVDRWLCELCGSEFVPRATLAKVEDQLAEVIEIIRAAPTDDPG